MEGYRRDRRYAGYGLEGDIVELGRWELLRALGRVAADPAAAAELGLRPAGETAHAEVFEVNCPPYAALYLGEDQGQLATLWTAAGLEVPPEPDHLAGMLDRYAGLGEGAGLDGARRVLLREFLWPWLPAYLGAVLDLPAGPLTRWAELTLDALRHERDQDRNLDESSGGPLPLPRALREAPPALGLGDPSAPVEPGGFGAWAGPGVPGGLDGRVEGLVEGRVDGLVEGLVEGLLTPRRSGMILTRRVVAAGAEQVGAGRRIGNRRRALAAMLAAAPERTARWLAGEADHWAHRHRAFSPDPVQLWWAERAAATARLLRSAPLAREAREAREVRVIRGEGDAGGCRETAGVSGAG